jgi:hypothetical protein
LISRAIGPAALLLVSVAAGLIAVEFLASAYVPAWPARALRSYFPLNMPAGAPGDIAKPWMAESFNSWGMRDREHSISRPPDTRSRIVFVGDSFVEFQGLSRTLPAMVEEKFAAMGQAGIETINLGVSGTGLNSYYYRLRDVALRLSPDVLTVFFFSGNDFLLDGSGYSAEVFPPLVDESPGRSLMGRVMPNANWLIVNRLRQSEVLKGNKLVPDEFAILQRHIRAPIEQRAALLARHMNRFYYPQISEDKLSEVLSRGDGRFLAAFEARPFDEEILAGWLPDLILRDELGANPFAVVKSREDAAGFVKPADVEANLSWLLQMEKLATSHGVPIQFFIIPVGSVDPEFVEFWKPWPRYYSWYLHCDLRHDLLVQELRKTHLSFVDLKPVFNGIPGTYRKSDAHWTELGLRIAADVVFKQLQRVIKAEPPASGRPSRDVVRP